ncbi:MAG TPA: MFS transporter [Candidatus Limnocylindrales bacterium]|nr:MFS transporter [Candidatus Limnocylindrales bacterium]
MLRRVQQYIDGFRGFDRDARVFLFTTLLSSGAISLFWINFNLYLAALGLSPSTIGLIATTGALSSTLAAIPASIFSDRYGRRLAMMLGAALSATALAGLLVFDDLPMLFLLAVAHGAGMQALFVVAVPFLTERSRAEHRSELFALQFAITNGTQVVAALVGGAIAAAVAAAFGHGAASPEAYRVLLGLMLLLMLAALASMFRLADDRPSRLRPASSPTAGDAYSAGARPPGRIGSALGLLGRLGIHIGDPRLAFKLLLPGFLIALGAGQVIPFLNLYVQGRFQLELSEVNAVFAVTAFGTMLAILLQPALARRYGKIGSVVIVQAASIPFLVVLGFAPLVWLVIIAMAVRNSLMNAGNPILNAFVMERVSPRERATMAAAMSLLWSFGWVLAGLYYSAVQATLGFDAGYALNFITIIVLYSVATALYWLWFRHVEDRRPTPSAETPSSDAVAETGGPQ